MKQLVQDLRVALRSLRRSPVFLFVAVTSIAVAAGLTAVVAPVVYQELAAPLPYADPDRLVAVWEVDHGKGVEGEATSLPNLVDWRQRNDSFRDLAAATTARVRILTFDDGAGGTSAVPVPVAVVTPGYFHLLGAEPSGGAFFRPEEKLAPASAALLSEGLARRHFGDSEAAVGETFSLAGRPVRVRGVVPESFQPPQWRPSPEARAWFPLPLEPRPQDRRYRWLSTVGRLKDGVGLATADAEMKTVSGHLAGEYPEYNQGFEAEVVPLRQALTGERKEPLSYAAAGLGVFLALVLVNLTTLALARFGERRREQAVRSALGAGGGALFRSWLLEGLLIFLGGGALGLALAAGALRWLRPYRETLGLRFAELSASPALAAGTLAFCALAALAFALLPWLRGRSTGPAPVLAGSSGLAGSEGPGWRRLRQAFVGLEVTLAFAFLLVTGLLGRSLWTLHHEPLGFEPEGLMTAEVILPISQSSDDPRTADFLETLLERWQARPAVEDAGAVSTMPLAGTDRVLEFAQADDIRPGETWRAAVGVATPGYFDTAGLRLVEGRLFHSSEMIDVAVVNQALVEEYFPDSALHKGLRMENDTNETYRWIVGVVEDVHQEGPSVEPFPQVYLPHRQRSLSTMTLVARASDPTAAAGALKAEVQALGDGRQHVIGTATGGDLLEEAFTGRRLALALAGACATGGLAVALLGIFGLVSYSVTRRRGEIGIRKALGADRKRVLGLVLGQTLGATLLGLAAGAGLGLIAGGLMGSLLYGVSMGDPLTYGGLALAFLAVALAAAWLPARRALAVSPASTLKAS